MSKTKFEEELENTGVTAQSLLKAIKKFLPSSAFENNVKDVVKIVTATLPLTDTKLDMSGAVILYNTKDDLFDIPNSRILNTGVGTLGQVAVSMQIDSSAGNNRYVSFYLKGFAPNGIELFSKRQHVRGLVKGNATDAAHVMLEYYWGADATVLGYMEVWFYANNANPYTNPDLTIMQL